LPLQKSVLDWHNSQRYSEEKKLTAYLENDFELDRGPSGRLATPYTKRQGLLSLPKTSCSNCEGASAIFGWSRTSPEVATDTPSRTMRVTASSEPKCWRATARALSAARCGLACLFHIPLRADAPNEFRPVTSRGKHPAEKKQIAGLHRFCIGAERFRRRVA